MTTCGGISLSNHLKEQHNCATQRSEHAVMPGGTPFKNLFLELKLPRHTACMHRWNSVLSFHYRIRIATAIAMQATTYTWVVIGLLLDIRTTATITITTEYCWSIAARLQFLPRNVGTRYIVCLFSFWTAIEMRSEAQLSVYVCVWICLGLVSRCQWLLLVVGRASFLSFPETAIVSYPKRIHLGDLLHVSRA